jgi:spore coat protein U-like protein
MKLFKKVLLLTAAIGLVSVGAFAGNTSGNLSVTANVTAACVINTSSGAVAFGGYNPTSGTALTATGSFTLQCTNGANPTVLMGQGANPGTGSSDAAPVRQMASGGYMLGYQLYSDSARSLVWDNATGVSEPANGTLQTITVYGSIPAGQNVGAGSYTDTVVVNVNY